MGILSILGTMLVRKAGVLEYVAGMLVRMKVVRMIIGPLFCPSCFFFSNRVE